MATTETVRVKAVSFYTKDGEGKRRETRLTYGASVPPGVPAEKLEAWRERGFIAEGAAPRLTGAQTPGNPSPDSTAFDDRVGLTAEGVPPDAGEVEIAVPNVLTADVATIATYIDSAGLNGPDTVALAGGDPALALRVIEAENLAHGGDGRKTVIDPLSKLTA